MTEKTRRSFFIGSIASVFVMTVAVLFGCKSILFKPLKSSFVKASGSEYSVTFKNSNFYSQDESDKKTPVYTFLNQTPSGNDIYLVTRGGNFRNTSGIGNVSTNTSDKSLMQIRFYKDAAGTREFKHQNILSISIKTNNNESLQIQTCSDGVAFTQKTTLNCTSSGVTYSDFNENDRFIAVAQPSQSSNSRYVKEITITYECQNAVDPTFDSTKIYEATVLDKHDASSHLYFVFNSDHYGYYKFYYNGYNNDAAYYTNLFTWQFDLDKGAVKVGFIGNSSKPTPPSSIDDVTASGGNEEYQGYRLFVYNNTSFYNYLTVWQDSLSVYFHTQGAPTSTSVKPAEYYKSYRRSLPITLTQQE